MPQLKARYLQGIAKVSSAVIYEGPSLIDGAPIVAIAIVSSSNAKTGNMVQTYILRADLAPIEAVKTGADASICGGCVHRGDGTGKGRTCYVNLGQGPRSVYVTYRAGKYRTAAASDITAIGAGRMVRLGTYGDPAAVPVSVWHALLAESTGHTGYTHQWRSERLGAPLRGLVMASCETAADVQASARKGFTGSFRVLPRGDMPQPSEVCPASAEGGKTMLCSDCGRCDGKGGAVAIVAHGATAGRYTGRRVLPTLVGAN